MVVDWTEKKLGDIAEIRMCKRIFAEQTTPNGEIPFYKIGTFGKEPDAYISNALYQEYKSKYSFPNKGDILLSAAGTLGRTTIYDGKPAYFQDSNIVWLEIDKNQICNEYLNHCYQVMAWASPEGSTISRLYNGIIRNTDITLPPLPEQTAIAEALSDADSLIASLEKLIAKKKAIKHGAMQELLTGKTRLPGFSGEWVDTSVDSFADIISGGTPPTNIPDYWNGDILWCTPTDITSTEGRYVFSTEKMITQLGVNNSAATLLPLNTLLLCSRATIGEIKIAGKPITTNQGFKSLAIKDNYSFVYVYYLIILSKNKLIEKAIGSTFLEISKKDLSSISFALPPTLDEQTAIASILSDMDAEIEQLEKKLAKYRLIKQGMMQELFTGRIRLIETDNKAETAPKGHNQQYDDAIAISAIVNAFYDDRFILGRVKVQKLLYLLRRKQDADVSAFKKKVAGPYNEEARYKGGESIAVKSGYIAVERNNKGSKFSKGSSIDVALKYVGNMQPEIDWLLEKFRFYNTNKDTKNLEVLATVDMAVCELEKNGKVVNLDAVKDVIGSNKEWAPKLTKPFFTDAAINQAITESKALFGQEYAYENS